MVYSMGTSRVPFTYGTPSDITGGERLHRDSTQSHRWGKPGKLINFFWQNTLLILLIHGERFVYY